MPKTKGNFLKRIKSTTRVILVILSIRASRMVPKSEVSCHRRAKKPSATSLNPIKESKRKERRLLLKVERGKQKISPGRTKSRERVIKVSKFFFLK
jgi:hypothetical protein